MKLALVTLLMDCGDAGMAWWRCTFLVELGNEKRA